MIERAASIHIRNCQSLDEFGACVRLQADVWGYAQEDVVPRRVFVVASKIGGQVIGAFDTSRAGARPQGEAATLIGFAMALPGFSYELAGSAEGEPYLHSHMLAVRSEYRQKGIGRRLKLFQREEALSRRVVRMEWTFDPLEIKNASLNIARLGAIVRRYEPNLYGVSSSRLQGALPTDRLYAEWWMNSERVNSILSGEPALPPRIEQTILVPRAIGQWKQSPAEQALALRVQQENRRQFEEAFSRGLAVIGYAVRPEGDGVFQLGRWETPPKSSAHRNRAVILSADIHRAGSHEN